MISGNRFAGVAGVFTTLVCLLTLQTVSGQNIERDTQKLNTRLTDINAFFAAVMASPQTAIPQKILGNAKGIIIVMQNRGGRFMARKGGSGIVIVRDERSNKLGIPAFIQSQDENWGWLVNAKPVNTIYLLMDSDGLSILSQNRFRIGSGVKAAVGPTTAQPDLQVEASILLYCGESAAAPGTFYAGGILYGEVSANHLNPTSKLSKQPRPLQCPIIVCGSISEPISSEGVFSISVTSSLVKHTTSFLCINSALSTPSCFKGFINPFTSD